MRAVPEGDAAHLFQSVFRKDRSRKQAAEMRNRERAAIIIGDRASEFLAARRAIAMARNSRDAKAREDAAANLQVRA